MYVLRAAELARAGPPLSQHGGLCVPCCQQPALLGPRAHPPGWKHAPPGTSLLRQAEAHLSSGHPPSPLLGFAPRLPPEAQGSVLSEPSGCGSAKPPAYAEPPPPRPARSVCHTPDSGPSSLGSAGTSPARETRFRSCCWGPASCAPGRVRTRPAAGIRPILQSGTASGGLSAAECREALGSQSFSGACVSRTWSFSTPGPSHGPAHQRQLATRVSGTLTLLRPSHSGRPTAP